MFRSRMITCTMVAAACGLLWSGPGELVAEADLIVESSALYDVTLDLGFVPPLVSAPRQGPIARSAANSQSFGAAQAEVEEIELQDFEGDDFPPPDWSTWDNDAPEGGSEETYTWGIQDCDTPSDTLGLKAAWSVGGGRLGAELLCGGNYDQPARSWLMRSGIDSTIFPSGIQVNMRFKVDIPLDEAFQICASTESATTIACSNPLEPTPGRWLSFRDPIVFARAGGLENAAIFLRYEDPSPSGGETGVYVDDVLIEGLTGEAQPTVTSTPIDGPSPEPTASRPPPTDPGPLGPRIFLPYVVDQHNAGTDPVKPPTASPGRLAVEFAEDFLVDGTAITPGPRFSYGIVQLCAKQSWFDVMVGREIRRQWSAWNGSEFRPLGGPDLNNALAVPTTNGFFEQCVQWEDVDRSPVPVPLGRYRVELFHGASTEPAASGIAEVLGSDPATSVPGTPVPTTTPTTAPTGPPPTPEPGDCFDPVENGDFEAGPGEGWIERTVAVGGLIREERAFDGSRFGALFGTVLGIQETLQGQRAIPNRAEDAIEAATLRFVLLMVSEETAGAGAEDDVFGVCVGGNTDTDVECIARASEDTWPRGSWIAVEQDVTDYFVVRDNFDTSTLLFIAQTNATLTTNFAMDNVELEICLTGGERIIVPLDGVSTFDGPSAPYRIGDELSESVPALRSAPEPSIQSEGPGLSLLRLAPRLSGFGSR